MTILPAKRFQLSFPEINSDWAEILHGAEGISVPLFIIFYGSTFKNAIKIWFFFTTEWIFVFHKYFFDSLFHEKNVFYTFLEVGP